MGMNAIAESCTAHKALQELYKEALQNWTTVRALNAPSSQEVIEATRRVEELERQLTDHQKEHKC